MDIGAVRADISLLKGRIGEGFVEAILRRAGYFVARVGRETQLPRLMKSGTDTYLPDLLAWRQENTGGEQGDTPLYRFVAVEVKYRWNPDDLLRRPVPLELADAHRQWPDFRVVLVTDHPPEGRSCFQVVRWNDAGVAESEDLVNAGLDIYQGTIDIFSALLKEVFRVLSDATAGDNLRGGN